VQDPRYEEVLVNRFEAKLWQNQLLKAARKQGYKYQLSVYGVEKEPVGGFNYARAELVSQTPITAPLTKAFYEYIAQNPPEWPFKVYYEKNFKIYGAKVPVEIMAIPLVVTENEQQPRAFGH